MVTDDTKPNLYTCKIGDPPKEKNMGAMIQWADVDVVQEIRTQPGAQPLPHHFFERGAVVFAVAVTAGGRPLFVPEDWETLLVALF